jgi:phosphoribosylamine---glycine ligase
MNILVVGNGGRECALANSLMLSKQVTRVFISEPNPGVYDPHHDSSFRQVLEGKYSARFKSLNISPDKKDELIAAALREEVNYVVIGPEVPLADGLSDHFTKAGINVIGPNKKAAKLESSKEFAKKFMKKHEIPTADWKLFTAKDIGKAEEFAKTIGYPVAVKADGLCAGKGVIICNDVKALNSALELMFVKEAFGSAGKKVIIEKGLIGKEISFIGLFDGESYVAFPPATDYKRLKDNDKGPNTGGMGSIAPSPYAIPEVKKDFETNILSRFIEGCKEEEIDYCGFIYFGCILTNDGLKLLEFNVRMGDPEAQAILPLLRSDLARLFELCSMRRLVRARPSWSNESTCTVILASEKYPDGKSSPQAIFGLDKIAALNERIGVETSSEEETTLTMHPFRMPPVSIFLAGVNKGDTVSEHAVLGHRTIYASGGRVLGITARGATLSAARKLAYDAVSNLQFKGMHYRTDIGKVK